MTARNRQARLILREGYAAGEPVAALAARAGVTYGSAKVIAHKMGLRHPSGSVCRHLPAEKQVDFAFLTASKKLSAKEALQALGVKL